MLAAGTLGLAAMGASVARDKEARKAAMEEEEGTEAIVSLLHNKVRRATAGTAEMVAPEAKAGMAATVETPEL